MESVVKKRVPKKKVALTDSVPFVQGRPRKKLRPVQHEALELLERNWHAADVFVVNLPVGCHGLGERILMYDGSTKAVETITEGELVMGPDGHSRTVIQTYKGRDTLNRVIPKRGESWTVTDEHVLCISEYTRKSEDWVRTSYRRNHEVRVKDYKKWSTDKKKSSYQTRVGIDKWNHHLETSLAIPPYILGAWLGDGTSTGPSLTGMDPELMSVWEEWGKSLGLYIRIATKPDNKASTMFLTRNRENRKNLALEFLKDYNLINNKHIPKEYLFGSREVRLQVLAGLIDTDSSFAASHNSVEIIQKNELLLDQIIFLARSLGYSASKLVKIINNVNYFRTHISGQTLAEVPTLLKRKKLVSSHANMNNYKFKIEELGEQDFAGIQVDQDNLYLMADFTVTHNSGKSMVAQTVAKWSFEQQGSPAITLVPNNILLDQYLNDYPSLHALRGKKHYYCNNLKMTLEERGFVPGSKLCSEFVHCEGCNKYRWILKKNWSAPRMLTNYHTYLAHRLHKRYSTVVIDEAHNLIPVLQEMSQSRIWRHQLPVESQYPLDITSTRQLSEWVDELPESLFVGKKAKIFNHFRDTVGSDKYIFKAGYEDYHGEERHCLKLIPVDIRDEPAMFFPSTVKKIVLLSATISSKDVEQLGLYTKKVKYLTASSPIPVSQRPVIVLKEAVSMSYANQKANLPLLVSAIKNILEYHDKEKGLIHAPYALAKEAAKLLKDEPRLLFHSPENKKEVYKKFRDATEPMVLLASGMYEGVDLPYDAGRFQIIAKVPYPSLAEPAIAHKAASDPSWYSWETSKILQQSFGRIVRSADDFGVTYILDSAFRGLYKKTKDDFYPPWLAESIIDEEDN